ncbi:MAG: alkaline phosphatase family protein [Desulfobacterales bacterium]|nr:alkaline phosphatase family protein [Desulfobacterales bacterium]
MVKTKRTATRCILVLLDGLGDRSYPRLGHRTPLQAARTPILDALAARGANGLFHASGPGIALASENAHFAMFGYRPDQFPGRGILEAMGAGIKTGPDTVAFLAHFIHARAADDLLFLEQHRPVVTAEEARAVIKSIACYTAGAMQVEFRQTRGLDGILCLTGAASRRVTDTDPVLEKSPVIAAQPLGPAIADQRAVRTAEALNSYICWCHHTLNDHPLNRARAKKNLPLVNGIVTQRPGRWTRVVSFSQQWGLKAISISSGIVYWGLAEFLGMEAGKVSDSADPGADLADRLRLAVGLADDYEFIHVHSKAPDQAAHTKDPVNKVAVIEALDAGIGRVADQLLDNRTILIITADHSTPSSGPQIHSGEPVPIMAVGPGMRVDAIKGFDEIQCAGGALGSVRGVDFMPMVLNFLDKAKLQGLMDTPDDQPYWPGCRTALRLKK